MDIQRTFDIGTGAAIAFIVAYLVLLGFTIWAFTKIMGQAGYSGHWAWLYVGLIIPFVNFLVMIAMIVLYFMFAFKEWPVRRELRELRAWADEQYRRSGGGGAYPPAGGYPTSGGMPQQPGYGTPPQGNPGPYGYPTT